MIAPTAKEKKSTLSGVDLALSCTSGNASALARALGITPQAVSDWKRRGQVPARAAKRIASLFGVPKSALNPIFK